MTRCPGEWVSSHSAVMGWMTVGDGVHSRFVFSPVDLSKGLTMGKFIPHSNSCSAVVLFFSICLLCTLLLGFDCRCCSPLLVLDITVALVRKMVGLDQWPELPPVHNMNIYLSPFLAVRVVRIGVRINRCRLRWFVLFSIGRRSHLVTWSRLPP